MINKTATSLCALAACAALVAMVPQARAQVTGPAPSYDIPPPPGMGAPAPPPQPMTYAPMGPTAPQPVVLPPDAVPAQALGDEWNVRAAHRNVRESRWYDHLLETSPGFRAYRMRKECGPVTDPQLHESCIASFGQAEPAMYGSSRAPYTYRNGAGE